MGTCFNASSIIIGITSVRISPSANSLDTNACHNSSVRSMIKRHIGPRTDQASGERRDAMKFEFTAADQYSRAQKNGLAQLRAAVYPPEVLETLPARFFTWAP